MRISARLTVGWGRPTVWWVHSGACSTRAPRSCSSARVCTISRSARSTVCPACIRPSASGFKRPAWPRPPPNSQHNRKRAISSSLGDAALLWKQRTIDPMATKKSKGLGMGLEALLGPKVSDQPAAAPTEGAPTTLRLDLMQAGKYQPRTRMDEGSLYELAESIKSQGIMQPILVRPIGGGRYEIIAGERRSRAARLAGLAEVPVLIREVPDEAAAVMALIENIQREDLNPLEEAQ